MQMRWRRHALAFLAALVVAVIWGAVVQTQFNLAALQALGADVPLALRIQTTLQDLLGFGPLYAALVGVALGLAFVVAALIARVASRGRGVLFALAGFAGLIAAIRIVDSLVPPPVLIAATRSTLGLIAMTLGGAWGGGLYARLTGLRP